MYMSNSDSFWNHPIETIEKALHIRKQIAALEEGLKDLFAGKTFSSTAAPAADAPKRRGRPPGKRTMSPEARAKIVAAPAKKGRKGGMSAAGRARIAAAQKLRWSKVNAAKGASAPAPAKAAAKSGGKKKRQLSPEARARIVAAVKARWAKAKKAKG
jgi:hypothetical protein